MALVTGLVCGVWRGGAGSNIDIEYYSIRDNDSNRDSDRLIGILIVAVIVIITVVE